MNVPCRRSPDAWFAVGHVQKGLAIHMCVEHCSRLKECDATEPRPTYGVLAGVAYGYDATPLRAHKQPAPVPCDACVALTDPRPAPQEGCGTMRAYRRHVKKRERPCRPCADAYNRDRNEFRARQRARRAA